MAKVMFFSVPLHGHVNPSLGLIKKLVEQGEEVIYYSSEPFRAKIEGAGARFMSYRGLVEFGTYGGDGIDALLVFADFILGLNRVIIDQFRDEVQAFRPDYILHDTFCYWGREFARLLGVPGIAVFANFAFIAEMAEREPEFFMENILRAANHPLYKKYKGQTDISRMLLDKLSHMLALKYGVKDLNVLNDIFGGKEQLNLLFTSREFQLDSEAFDSSYLLVGPALYEREEPVEFPFEKLDGRPLIYVSLGTIFNNRIDIYQNCLQAFEAGEVQVVMAVGNKVRLEELGEIPENVIVCDFAPQLALLKRAAVFITHGGANSVNESLCLRVPMVVVPQAFDQFLGAIMVEKAGAGIYLKSSTPEAAEFREAVRKVWAEKSYRENCGRIRASFDTAASLDYAVDQIFKYIKNQSIF